ncbi:calcyphosin-2 isoform X2 [Stegostoma tigrinum]|uniref:calcyphosin-2 isoform X2 n=1 Tax=Stegostoma tigrinum TaxID=3053191 RepID=UPI0028703160|nr:calcyphosin-2 isoform X2 [Stegostoma tigrinum]
MDLEVKGIGTASTRQKSAKGWRIRSSDAYGPRPDDVPALDLRRLDDSDGEPCPVEELTIPENLPVPSDNYKLKYQQYKEEMKMKYKEHTQQITQRSKSSSSGRQPTPAILQMQQKESPFGGVAPESLTSLDEKATLQQCYTSKPFSMGQSMRKLEAEDLAAEKRKQAVVEQVLVDQLSRAVISDPGQDVGTTDLSQQQTILPGLGSAPLRFKSRKLHQTRVKTSSTLTENVLSNKLRFDARIISRNGRDACRELIGFFFAFDKSVTVYEHRHFGKNRTKALPFIQRGIYCHQHGRRKRRQYDVGDFNVGANLTFLTSQHVGLPASIQEKRLLILRIIEIDEIAKHSLLTGSNPTFTQQEIDDRNTILSVQGLMKEKLVNRGVRTMTGLVKFFHRYGQCGGGLLSEMELKQGLKEFHLELADKDFKSVWLLLDQDGDGEIDYYQFIQVVIGEMIEYRKAFVRKAYMKLDPNKTGSVSVNVISKFYNGRKHPKVLSGECSEQQIRTSFLDTLQENCINSGEVTYSEFEAYYEGLSLEVANDEDFANIMRNCWAL